MLSKDEYLKFKEDLFVIFNNKTKGLEFDDTLPIYKVKALGARLLFLLEDKYVDQGEDSGTENT